MLTSNGAEIFGAIRVGVPFTASGFDSFLAPPGEDAATLVDVPGLLLFAGTATSRRAAFYELAPWGAVRALAATPIPDRGAGEAWAMLVHAPTGGALGAPEGSPEGAVGIAIGEVVVMILDDQLRLIRTLSRQRMTSAARGALGVAPDGSLRVVVVDGEFAEVSVEGPAELTPLSVLRATNVTSVSLGRDVVYAGGVPDGTTVELDGVVYSVNPNSAGFVARWNPGW